MSLPLMLLVTAASFLQIAVLPLLTPDPWAMPLLPVALLAAWSVNRSHDEPWPALLLAAALLGVLSTQRVGWFLVALLPVALLGAALAQTHLDEEHGLLWRLPATAGVAGLGSLAYLLLLATVGRELGSLAGATPAVIVATFVTSVIAAMLAPLLQPRRQRHGLFA
ncbi:MAG: hypothetical protein HOH95_14780 [Dehalococcoidia bacterium]|jgi:hypothetical protein|nr:hypothetical protein [Dehalococcoidia bacterium]